MDVEEDKSFRHYSCFQNDAENAIKWIYGKPATAVSKIDRYVHTYRQLRKHHNFDVYVIVS